MKAMFFHGVVFKGERCFENLWTRSTHLCGLCFFFNDFNGVYALPWKDRWNSRPKFDCFIHSILQTNTFHGHEPPRHSLQKIITLGNFLVRNPRKIHHCTPHRWKTQFFSLTRIPVNSYRVFTFFDPEIFKTLSKKFGGGGGERLIYFLTWRRLQDLFELVKLLESSMCLIIPRSFPTSIQTAEEVL